MPAGMIWGTESVGRGILGMTVGYLIKIATRYVVMGAMVLARRTARIARNMRIGRVVRVSVTRTIPEMIVQYGLVGVARNVWNVMVLMCMNAHGEWSMLLKITTGHVCATPTGRASTANSTTDSAPINVMGSGAWGQAILTE
jgi:hypothetical protein